MSRLIEVDSLTKRLIEFCNKNCPYTAKARDIMCGSCFMGLALEAVEDVPTIDSEQRWIPCSEILPEEEYVLISKKPTKLSGSKWCVTIAIRMEDPRSRKVNWRDIGFGVIPDDNVLAWMPLPEPWKEGDNK